MASQTLCSGASSRCRTRQRDSSPALVVTTITTSHHCWGNSIHWLPVRQRVDFKTAVLVYKALHDSTAAYLVDDCQLVGGYDRPTSTRALCHGPTRSSATGVSQSLDHGSGTVCRPDNDIGEFRRQPKSFFVSVTLRRIVTSCFYTPRKYSYSLTRSQPTHYSSCM